MTAPLILPRHVADARRKQQQSSVANAITKSATNHLSSDDFVTFNDVISQLGELKAYIQERQQTEPDYALPSPLGWRIAVLMLTIPEVSAGGVHMVDDMREARSVASPQGVVLAMGSAAYQDPARFAEGGEITPWVCVGDRILWKKYDVTTFQLANGQRIGFMNDTQPVGIVDRNWLMEGDE